MSVVALLLAAGRGRRMGRGVPKAFLPLAGRPLLLHALEALLATPQIDRVLPVLGEGELASWPELMGRIGPSDVDRVDPPVAGGAERQDSVRAGVAALPADAVLVAVHDAARALVRPASVGRVIEVARREGAAILAVPVRDTIKRVAGDRIEETPPRTACWAAQTPQVFRTELLREALAKAAAGGYLGTDCAELVERLGVPVRVVEGDVDNLKITHPEDLVLAEHVLAERARAGGS
ncbi:MAG: 2-C-methyl-D-erythritol 4-phosphate cytidylyltransferase [Myxococcota bacterium]|nr:2-C-methyl-D-erythritol 4-phosphate cytidylyltransferase [Myxococcota bacterium]